jgi:hypothetical protein
MHSHRRRTLRVHVDTQAQPIPESAICCCCEDDAGQRIASYRRAQQHGDYPDTPREPLASGRCAFCRLAVGAR